MHSNERPQLIYRLDEPQARAEQLRKWKDELSQELKELGQFVLWRLEFDSKRQNYTKIPYNPRTHRRADPTDAATWATFDEVLAAIEQDGASKYDGIGFVLTSDDPFVVIDLDKCRDAVTEEISSDALATIHGLWSYTELSPSGTGAHIILRGKLPPGGRRKGNVEVYDNHRFITLTAHRLDSQEIVERNDQLAAWYAEIFPPSTSSQSSDAKAITHKKPSSLSDDQILKIAFKASNGQRTESLYNGDISAYNQDDSAADFALIKRLAFYTKDEGQLDRLFRSSKLYRPKWDRRCGKETYGQRTVRKALLDSNDYFGSKRQSVVHRHNPSGDTEHRLGNDTAIDDHQIQDTHQVQDNPQIQSDQRIQSGASVNPTSVLITKGQMDGERGVADPTDKSRLVQSEVVETDLSGVENLPEPTNLDVLSNGEFRWLRPFSYLNDLPERRWAIDGILPLGELIALVGRYGNGKTLMMLDMALCIACDVSFHGYKVQQGPVVIIETEGVSGLKSRIQAWMSNHPDVEAATLERNVIFIPEAVQICEPEQIESLLSDLRRLPQPPALIVIDTLARANEGRDENSARDMSVFVAACDRIRRATGGAVMVLHHTGKNGEIRGSSVFTGSVDATVMCAMDSKQTTVTLSCDKLRDKMRFKPIRFAVTPDERSGSIYLKLADKAGTSDAEDSGLTSNQKEILDALKAADAGLYRLNDIMKMVPTLSLSIVQKAVRSLVKEGQLIAEGNANQTKYHLPGSRSD